METVRQKSSDLLKSHGFSDDTVQAQMTILKELVSSGNKFGSLRANRHCLFFADSIVMRPLANVNVLIFPSPYHFRTISQRGHFSSALRN